MSGRGDLGGESVEAVSERDVWLRAGRLVERHGAKARMIATMRAAELEERGDDTGCCTWRRIVRAVEAFQSAVQQAGRRPH